RDPVGELARQYRLVNQLSDYHETREQLPKLDLALADKLAQLEQMQGDENDKQFQKARKKLAADVENLRQQIAESRKKLARVEGDPLLKQQADAHPDIATAARL